MDSAQDSYKKWGIIFIVFLLILIPAEISLLKKGPTEKSKSNVNLQPNQSVEAAESSHPALYFVELEYDPTTKTAIRVDAGGFIGDKEQLDSSPANSNKEFSYKIETFSPSGELLLSGWISRSKFVISTKDGKYRFRANIPYIPSEILTISSTENKLLWSGKII